jgi:hypothetical protein
MGKPMNSRLRVVGSLSAFPFRRLPIRKRPTEIYRGLQELQGECAIH